MLPPSSSSSQPSADAPRREDATTILARRARAGDAACFGALYERIGPSLYVWTRLRVRPPLAGRLDPEDVAQEVWCRASARFASFDAGGSGFRAWIFAIAKLVLLEAYRSARRPDRAAATPDATTGIAAIAADATSISRRAARDEGISRFIERVAALPDGDRQVFVHCGLEGLTAADAATRLGATPDAVKKRWQRLRRRLEEEGLPAVLVD